MAELPHDMTDLRLAPVALAVEDQIEQLGSLSPDDLAFRVAISGDLPDWTEDMRRDGVLRTVTSGIEMHGWQLELVERGIRMHHGDHALVLGIPETVRRYVASGRAVRKEQTVGS